MTLNRLRIILIIGFCILLCVILTVNNNTFCFATIDKVFYYVASILTTCFGPKHVVSKKLHNKILYQLLRNRRYYYLQLRLGIDEGTREEFWRDIWADGGQSSFGKVIMMLWISESKANLVPQAIKKLIILNWECIYWNSGTSILNMNFLDEIPASTV
jgi:hypothetical protein